MLIGRDKEIEGIIGAVSQRKNLFLSGPGGAGKTSYCKACSSLETDAFKVYALFW